MTLLAGILLAGTSALLFGYGLNLLFLTVSALRLPRSQTPSAAVGNEPLVCVQVPVYNERYVAVRVLDAVCALDWPRDRLEIQVLDDSDDDTSSIVAVRVAEWQRRGRRARHVLRRSREGYKAGALAHGLALTRAPLIAIFDADFVPPPDFLRRTVPMLADPDVGFVQARWGHLNRDYSWLTRLQALAIDFHFLVEQPVRARHGYLTNFTGTAGVWRRSAIDDAGGWTADTLTEDLDLSYRAQLRGWRGAYTEDVVVPEELPVSVDGYRRQQYRWATGSFQSAVKLLWPLLRSRHRPFVKLQAAIHLLSYAVGPLMLVQLATYPALLLGPRHGPPLAVVVSTMLVVPVTVAPSFGFLAAQWRARGTWRSVGDALGFQVLGAGLSLTALLAFLNALRGGREFVRTPKHGIDRRGQEWRDHVYVGAGETRSIGDALAAVASGAIAVGSVVQGRWLLAAYSSIFALGFLMLATASALDAVRVLALRWLAQRRPARRLRWFAAVPLLAVCAGLLLAAAQLPEPFEDGYAHWLMAANLALTGRLHDPLFGMEDTWLPGYHLVAAAILHVFGTWNLGALKTANALLGAATLASVFGLARSRREGALAVALLALNPVFLFTSGQAVAEPLLTALLVTGALAAVRGRLRLGVVLAMLACATGTKAWLWVLAAAAAALVPAIWPGLRARHLAIGARRAAWAVPAIAVPVLFELGSAPAAHSLARGSTEVASAITRGSLPADALSRLTQLSETFLLAALPLLALGGLGLWSVARRRDDQDTRRRLAYLYVPSLVYLGAVFALVGAGVYSGSHRYFYPALPGLALLAATGLASAPTLARGAILATTGATAIAFLPVFAGFGALDAGLAAAGRAAGPGPGVLLTDSPVAAYYSGRSPVRIVGSAGLPSGHDEADAWLREHGVSALVLEDISYYRSTAVFPDLAAGRAQAPFRAVGDQASYTVPAGKRVHVYALEPDRSIAPGLDVRLGDGPGSGKTAGLARGATLAVDGADAAGEGMGFGVPIVHYPDGWVYARADATVTQSTPNGERWQRTFVLDEIGGDAARGYTFQPTAPRGTIEVTYTPDATGIGVTIRVLELQPGFDQVAVLNEESAAFDDFSAPSGASAGAAIPPWAPVAGGWGRLNSRALAAAFSVPSMTGAELHVGREDRPPEFDWAGLDYTFPASFAGASYHVTVEEAT